MNNFKSTNREDQEHEFHWIFSAGDLLQPDADNITVDEFTVLPLDRNLKGSYTIQVLVTEDEAKIVSQTRINDESVKGKGICEAMLPELYKHYGKIIISSSEKVPTFPGENRVKNVTRIYTELEAKGLVEYDEKRDIFIYPKQNL